MSIAVVGKRRREWYIKRKIGKFWSSLTPVTSNHFPGEVEVKINFEFLVPVSEIKEAGAKIAY